MTLRISSSEVLAKFDRLVKKKELHFTPPTTLLIKDQDFQFQILITPTLSRKPLYTTPSSTTTTPPPTEIVNPPKTKSAPPPPLFSDPDPDFQIASLPPSHTLILNKYCALRPQYILHSTIPQPQSDYLNIEDWTAAWMALGALEDSENNKEDRTEQEQEWVLTYNCGEKAGASRSHKHLQLFPYSKKQGSFKMFPDAHPSALLESHLPFSTYISRSLPHPHDPDAPKRLKEIYDDLLHQAITRLNFQDQEMAHNLIMVRDWMLLVPRSKARIGKAATGATGVVGMVWVGQEEELEKWRKVGFLRALGEMGIGRMSSGG